MELATGGVEGTLLFFGRAVGDQRSTFVIQGGEHDLRHRSLPQPRALVQVRDARRQAATYCRGACAGSRQTVVRRHPVRLLSDMWKPYLRVIHERCTNAVNILDRFHIVAKMNDALDDVRAAKARRLAQDGFQPASRKPDGACSSARPISPARNATGFAISCATTSRRCGQKEDFQQFWDHDSPGWAAKFLDDWCQQAMRSRIEPMKKIANTLRGHRELILN